MHITGSLNYPLLCAHAHRGQEEGIVSHGAGVPGRLEPPNLDAGDQSSRPLPVQQAPLTSEPCLCPY